MVGDSKHTYCTLVIISYLNLRCIITDLIIKYNMVIFYMYPYYLGRGFIGWLEASQVGKGRGVADCLPKICLGPKIWCYTPTADVPWHGDSRLAESNLAVTCDWSPIRDSLVLFHPQLGVRRESETLLEPRTSESLLLSDSL